LPHDAEPLEDARSQISLMLRQQEDLAPGLYRDLALYLQVLRDGLLPAVQQACFHLATQVVPERYGQLPPDRRLQFQQRLTTLVRRCTALLTVEQLMGLAAQQQRREHRRRAVQRQRLLDALLEGRLAADQEGTPGSAQGAAAAARADAPGLLPDSDPEAAAASRAPVQGDRSASDPTGSIDLSLDLPLSADLFEAGIPGLSRSSAAEPPAPSAHPAVDAPPAGDSPAARIPPPRQESTSELRFLQSLFQMAADGLEGEGPGLPDGAEGSRVDGAIRSEGVSAFAMALEGDPRPAAAEGVAELAMAATIEPLPPPDPRVTGTALPRDPLQQLRWWRHFDRALRRRLRNLSHALNVEMMRLGLAQGLLPLSMLDAVLDGQIEPLPAPTNLLRLSLPLPAGSGAPTEVLSLLLRTGDLEFDQPRLRTCRRRLEQRRRALRTMARRYRIWQRRVTALEAEQQWYRDNAQLQNHRLSSP
jgi:hypothetical protein